ncbi:hypothetical protein KAFR_0L00810 [Kazachstania africana CBS 2517]|uniref:CBM21 domain-containing protein n=1 Tax=Kazachstania africana (strain ATCC 22294 / BCRC 22015 / CBS 2517 / CECT 1963 / NBRC 1671 / NRRL Y-8276) TaxID=1071382 RepID=H2B239_KAZAF|nr:hypothetical protein KAFR_0L00810 [Kazachstania africana CBS 2517]CCF60689.1 hypothetical protein KAFR_0L00810 [Kazachstania africana CBS 2517]
MYIKVEDRKRLEQEEPGTDKENVEQQNVRNNTGGSKFILKKPMYIRKNSNNHIINHTNNVDNEFNNSNDLNSIHQLYSLNFLHKPQRVSKLNEDKFPEDELQRNTDLNKQIPCDGVSPRTPVRSPFNDLDSIDTFQSPVYKKSGELLKSSLKRRSKSLPTTPAVLNDGEVSQHGKMLHFTNAPTLIRSKSVHFDQKAPVKYFLKDESPINVKSRTAFEDSLSFLHKPLTFTQVEDSGSNDDFFTTENSMTFQMDNLTMKDESDKSLRKSKRFQKFIIKENRLEPKQSEDNVTTSNDEQIGPKHVGGSNFPKSPFINSTETSHNKLRTNKVIGLYNINFPILSNKNPKSLKLNIFVNLSRDKKCFLQDLTLHIQQRNAFSMNPSNDNTASHQKKIIHNNTSKYLIGKVLVKNIFYDKRVVVRYTWDSWKTAREVECVWLSPGDGILPGSNMDIFHFLIDDIRKIDTVGKLEFCIHYTTRNDHERKEFWDNNDFKNYKIDVVTSGFNNPFRIT